MSTETCNKATHVAMNKKAFQKLQSVRVKHGQKF